MSSDFHIPFFVVGCFWFYRSVRSCLALHQIPFLAPLTDTAMRPWISVVLLVRNAAAEIEAAVRELLAQRQVDLDLIVVDDRSDDSTPEILTALARDEKRLRIELLHSVPEGWLPKSHGYWRGTSVAAGDWLMLLEEPARLRDDVLARAVQSARQERISHLSLIPRMRPAGLLAPLSLSSLIDSLPSVAAANRDRPSLPWISRCTLIRSDAYRAVGGHETLCMTPISELSLAATIRDAGHRLRTVQAPDDVVFGRTQRGDTVVESLERMIAATGFHLVLLSLALAAYSTVWIAAVLGPFSDNVWGLWAAGGLASQAVPGVLLALVYRVNLLTGLLVPLTMPLELVASAFAMLRIRLRGGVRWRGRFYPIEAFKAAARDREADD